MTDAPRTTAVSTRIGVAASIAISAAATIAFALTARESSHFVRDDLVAFRDVASTPLLELLWRPIDLHFLPLHRISGFLIFRTAPWNFDVALCVLFAFQMLGVWMLHRTLERIGPSPLNAPLVVLYGTNFYLGVQFTWWAAGIARLPCLLLTITAIYGYLKFRNTGSIRHIAVVAGCLIAAAGFFSKGFLIPGYLAAIEIVYAWDTPRRQLARNLAAVAGIALVAIAMRAAGELVVAPYQLPPIRWSEQAEVLLAVAEMVQQGIFGSPPSQPALRRRLAHPGRLAGSGRRDGAAELAQRPHLAGGGRCDRGGLPDDRPVAARRAVRCARGDERAIPVRGLVHRRPVRSDRPPPLVSGSTGRRSQRDRGVGGGARVRRRLAAQLPRPTATPRYAEGAITRTYIENLKAGIAGLREEHDGVLAFRRGRVPPRVVGFSAESVRPLSVFLPLFDRAVRVTNRGYCLYKVNADGTIAVPAGNVAGDTNP